LKKLFVSIDLSDEIAGYLAGFVKHLPRVHECRLVPHENYHITANFIGYVGEDIIGEIKTRLEKVSLSNGPFYLELEKMIAGPPNKTPRQIWAVLNESPQYNKLTNNLRESLIQFSDSKLKEMIPHVTLVRCYKPDKNLRQFEREIEPGRSMLVGNLFLMESIQASKGVYYKPLAEYKLRG